MLERSRLALLGIWMSVGCAGPAPRSLPATATTSEVGPAPPAPIPGPSTSTASSEPPVTAPDLRLGPPLALSFRREIDGAISAIALEKEPHAAALGPDALWTHDSNGWRSEPLPSALLGAPSVELSLFFGRDYKVRITGLRRGTSTAEGLYYRWRHGKLEAEKSEIGRLGATAGPLVAVLGTADPEIVCRPGDICIVKSVKGWLTIPAPTDISRVTIGGHQGWAVSGQSLLRLDEEWHQAGTDGSWSRADALFATESEAWVLETDTDEVHFFDGSAWHVQRSPIAHPKALWGRSRDALWLGGEGGLAFFDGKVWSLAADAPHPIAAIGGRGEDVWVGGPGGLFKVARD